MKKGAALEQIIAGFEGALADKGKVTIERKKMLRDRVSKRLREHDVVLTFRENHHTVRVSIECRDRSRPVTQEQVEAFNQKCAHTGIDRGVIVATRGFYKTALTKAEHHRIDCLDLEDVAKFGWMRANGMQQILRRLDHQDWRFVAMDDIGLSKANMEVLDKGGAIMDDKRLLERGLAWLNELVPPSDDPIEECQFCVPFNGSGWSLRNKDTGQTTPVHRMFLFITYSVRRMHPAPFRLVRYGSKRANRTIGEAAVADFDLGEFKGKFIIVRKPEENVPL
jgi:hypothetical protein